MKDFSRFLQSHSSSLNELLSKSILAQNVNNDDDEKQKPPIKSNDTISFPFYSNKVKHISRLKQSSSIGIDYSFDIESISTVELVNSNNKCLNKTIAVFVQLCMEVRHLSEEGNSILVKCLFADEELCELLNQDDYEIEKKVPNNYAQVHGLSLSVSIVEKMNELLEMLFQAQQFIERCFVVISEIIKQLAALFAVESSNYINVDHSSLHFQVNSSMHMK